MDGSVSQMFQAGVDDYWRGWVPDKWNDAEHRASCAYCMGWYLESLADNGILPEPEDCDA